MRQPTNIALAKEIARRARIVAASRGVRLCDLVEEALKDSLPEWELQMLADEYAIPRQATMRRVREG